MRTVAAVETQQIQRSGDSASGQSASGQSALLTASRQGDANAFGTLVERNQNLVLSVAYSKTQDALLSQDIAQETFLAAWRSLGTLRDSENFRSWLCGIARNLSNKSLRAQKNQKASPGESICDRTDPAAGPLETVLSRESEHKVREALQELPETYREPLVLFYMENQSVKQVASCLGLTVDTAKQRLTRGRHALRAGVSEYLEQTLHNARPGKKFSASVVALVLAGAEASPASALSSTARPWLWYGAAVSAAVAALVVVVTVWTGSSLAEPSLGAKANAALPPTSETVSDSSGARARPARLVPQMEASTKGQGDGDSVPGSRATLEMTNWTWKLYGEDGQDNDMLLAKIGALKVLVEECYSQLALREPESHGEGATVRLDMHLSDDSDLGLLVASSTVDEEFSTIEDDEFTTCVTESGFVLDAESSAEKRNGIDIVRLDFEFQSRWQPGLGDAVIVELFDRCAMTGKPVNREIVEACMSEALGEPWKLEDMPSEALGPPVDPLQELSTPAFPGGPRPTRMGGN